MTPIATGIPQGSPISPILFLIYIRDIVAARDPARPQLLQLSYIDDFCIATSSTSAQRNCERLERVAAGLIAQATESRAQFDPSKTELIHFTTRRAPITEGITIAGLLVDPKPVVRWLGVHLDAKLSFKQHIAKRINLAEAALQRIIRLSSTQQRLSFQALRQLYIACIIAIANYRAQL